MTPQPLLKWAGGKRWLVDVLVPRIEAALPDRNTSTAAVSGMYIEPFVGGAAVAIAVGHRNRHVRMRLNDAVKPLIDFYDAVRRMPGAVAWALQSLAAEGLDEATYYRVRAEERRSLAQRAARFLYLNKTNYNGLWRENSRGEYNVPYGKRKVVRFPDEAALLAVSEALCLASLSTGDFQVVIDSAMPGDVIYADPPYAQTFSNYKQGGFTSDDHDRLAGALHDAWARGVTVFATNTDCPLVRDLYSWATFEETEERRAINSDGKGRAKVPCLLISAVHSRDAVRVPRPAPARGHAGQLRDPA